VLGKAFVPSICLIGEVEGDGCSEERAWISYGRKEGWRLVNTTDGGDGTCGWVMPKETREKISNANRGRKFTQEHRLKLSLAKIGRPLNKECRAASFLAHTGSKLSGETKRKIGNGNRGKIRTDEQRRNISLGKIEYYRKRRNGDYS
jgi:hypothetical protein